MTGGLIQLLTIGLQDAPLIINPEITFFKTTYRRHTNFSLEQILKNFGPKNFNTFFQYKITNVTDLLGGLHFIIDIPFFNIVKTIVTKTSITTPFDINELSVLYNNIKTYLLFEEKSSIYYLVPETFLHLSKNDEYYNQVNGFDLEKNLLANLNLLSGQNYGNSINILQLKNSELNQILPALRLKFNQWDEFWLRIFNEETNFLYFTNIVNQSNYVTDLQTKLQSILYNGYINFNVFNTFRNDLDFHDEIINYYIIDTNLITNPIYDSDFAENYAIDNEYSISTYKLNALTYNSLFYLFCLQSLYADFSSVIKGYTFWKKYTLGINNIVIESNSDYNYFLEWKNKEFVYNTTSFGNYNNLDLQIFNIYNKKYFETEQNIMSLYNNFTIQFKEKTWSILKVFYNQFTDDCSNQICFEDHFYPSDISRNLMNNNIDSFIANTYSTLNNTSNLDSSWTNFDDPEYIQPVDLDLVYPYLTYKYIDSLIVYNPNSFLDPSSNTILNQSLFIDNHFLVLFRNKITIAFAYRIANNLDNYYTEKDNNNSFQNVFLELNDANKKNKNLGFYHNINVNRNITLDTIQNKMNELFYCQSFYGTINIDTKDISSTNFILNAPSYEGLNDISYNMINNNLIITDEITFPTYDFSGNLVTTFTYDGNVISISNWNNTNYEKIFIDISGNNLPITKFNLTNNVLYLYINNLLINTTIKLKLLKERLIPVVDFVPNYIDISGNVSYPNISFNINDFPDTSFNLIDYPDISYNSTILYNTLNNIVTINNFVENNGNLEINNITFNVDKIYELKIKNYDNSIDRKFVNVNSFQLNLNNIKTITLLEYDFGLNKLNLVGSVINVKSGYIKIFNYTGNNSKYYWLFDSKNGTIIPLIWKPTESNTESDPTRTIFYLASLEDIQKCDPSGNYSVYEVTTKVPNLFPILHHYNNIDSSGNVYNYQLNSAFYQSPLILNINTSTEPLYYFYNIPSNENTTSITINNYVVNKLLPINPSEFYTYIDISGNTNKYPVVYDIINAKQQVTEAPPSDAIILGLIISKVEQISFFNKQFDTSYKQDVQFSNIVTLIENTNLLYQNFYLDIIATLKSLGSTISTVIDKTNLINYNNYDFDSYSLFVPTYYNQTASSICNGLGIQKFLIDQKGFILTQTNQIFDSSKKITNTSYLQTVSQTLVNNINYIKNYDGLISVYNSEYMESYKPKYYLENTVNQNIFTATDYKIQTLFDLSGNFSDSNTEIYFNNELIDISSNYIASGPTLYEVSEKKIYSTEIYKYKINDFVNDRFSYLGAVHFDQGNFVFSNSYDLSSNYILLDDLTIVDISNTKSDYLKINYNSYECTIEENQTIDISTNVYVYQLEIDTSGNDIIGNSVLINFILYNIEYDETYYYIYGYEPLDIKNKLLINGNSLDGTIDTFLPINSFLVNSYTIINNFETNLYIDASNNSFDYAIQDTSSNYIFLKNINTPTVTFISYLSPNTNEELYQITNKSLIPPFRLSPIVLVNDNKDFIINNFNNNYYYKLDNNIIKGSNLKDISGAYNFNVSVYSESNLKLFDTGKTVDISNGIITFDSTDKLPNYSYYYVSGYVYYIEKLVDGYDLTKNILYIDKLSTKLYLLHEDNFSIREQQYYTILDTSSTELLVPDIDTSSNNILIDYARINSSYYFNYKNSEGPISNNELDVIACFQNDSRPETFMIPYSFIYDISSNNRRVDISGYKNFYYYSTTNSTTSGSFIVEGGITDISCNDSDLQITGLNFTLNVSSGLKKYKLLLNGGAYYSYIWTLKIDSSLIATYDNILNLYSSYNLQNPLNLYDISTNPILFNINSGFSLLNSSNNLLFINNSQSISFTNIWSSMNRQQIYYDSNILTDISNVVPYISNITKLELNYDNLLDIPPKLDYYGYININQRNTIQLPNSNLKYIILIKDNTKYFRRIIDKIYLDKELDVGNYNVYGFSSQLFFIENEITIYNSSISSFTYNSLRKGDVIMLENNIFEVKGLNSFTNFYDLIPMEINSNKTYYNGYYLLFRLNATPKIPDTNIVEFTMDKTIPQSVRTQWDIGRLSIDLSNNLLFINYITDSSGIITDLSNNFSIPEGEELQIFSNGDTFFNVYNYQLKNNDYIQESYNSTVYRITNLNNGTFNLIDLSDNYISNSTFGNTIIINNFYRPYQPFFMININFDNSGNMTNSFDSLFYYELDGEFTNSLTQSIYNESRYTRVIQFPKEHLYFDINKNLTADISGNVIEFGTTDITSYNFYYNQPIKVNSFINYIRTIDTSNNRIYIDKSNYDTLQNQVKIYFGVKNEQELFNNYKLDKSCYVTPYINSTYFHYYDVSNNQLINYGINTEQLKPPNFIGVGTVIDFRDNIYNQDRYINQYNLHNSYHILLEQNKAGQFISHLCQFKIPNKLNIFTNVEDYSSKFFMDKMEPINLFSDNSFEYQSTIIYKQTLIPSLPYNELVIWKKINYNLTGIVETFINVYQIEIELITGIQYLGYYDFYMDKNIPCQIIEDIDTSGNIIYLLQTNTFPSNFKDLYVKLNNYITTSIKNNYTYNKNIIPNENFNKVYTYDSMKIPNILTYYRQQDYYYYSLDHDLSILTTDSINPPNITYSTGYLNLKVVEYYKDLSLEKRVLETNEEVILLDSVFVNNLSTNIFDPSRIYQDGDGTLKNIFDNTNFIISSLLNPVKSWNNWSLVTNPDIPKSVMSKGNFYYDLTTITRDSSDNYYTLSEVKDISSFLINVNTNVSYGISIIYIYNYIIFNDLVTLQNKFYENLPNFIRYNDFWINPVTYINNFIDDCDLYSTIVNPTTKAISKIVYDGQKLYYQDNILSYNQGNKINLDGIMLNNQFDVSFNGNIVENTDSYLKQWVPWIVVDGTEYFVSRTISNVNQEIYNLINNTYTQNVYGCKIIDVFNHLNKLSQNYIDFNTTLNTTSRKCVNFTDFILDNLKNILYSEKTDLSIDNFLVRGVDIISNIITYDKNYTDSIYLKDYPYLATKNLYQTNIPYDINYNVDTSAGLYPYKIQLTDETYADQTIYKIDFLDGDELNNLLTIDYPIVYNNQINFTTKENIDFYHAFSIAAYKTYDISSVIKIGYLHTLTFIPTDVQNIDFSLFNVIKYKNMELTFYDNYFIFPEITTTLTSYIQAETIVGVDSYERKVDKEGNLTDYTDITLLKFDQILNTKSTSYSLYFVNNGINYKIYSIQNKVITVNGILTTFNNNKLIITIKSNSIANSINLNLVQYQLTLTQALTNYSYYYDLKNVYKNFLINDVVYPQDLDFIGDSGMYVTIKTSDIPTTFDNIVHYSKVGEFPPEPIQNLVRENSFLYEFSDTPPIIDIYSCFICYDISYNSQDTSSTFLSTFIENMFIPGEYNIYYSTDVIKQNNKTQFVTNYFVNDQNLHYYTFGGVVNQWYLSQYVYIDERLKFTPDTNFIFNKNYYYYCNDTLIDMSDFIYNPSNITFQDNSNIYTGLNNGYIEFSVNLDLYDLSGNPIPIIFKQVIIEKIINKPVNNQVCTVTLFDPLDIRFDGYIQTLDKTNFELGNYIYKLNIDTSHNFITDTTVYFNSDKLIKGYILLGDPLYVVSKEPLDILNINSMYIEETNTTYTIFTLTLIVNAYIPFTLYKKLELGTYKLFIKVDDLDFLDNFIFPDNNLNKFYLVSKFAEFELIKQYDTQILSPSLVNIINNSTNIQTVTERVKFKDNLYRIFFDYIEFYINDQLIEQLNPDVMDYQYQFLKDPAKRKQLNAIVKTYETTTGIRFVVPLEFWFNGLPSLYLPIVSLNYSYLSVKYKIGKLLDLINIGNTKNMTSYRILNQPAINIQLNIDGIILDTPERELFGNNQHEYIIERFKTYPNTLINTVNNTARMKFKNMVKDIFFSTEIISSGDKCYYTTKIKNDTYSEEFYYLKPLYLQFVQIGVYNAENIQYNNDFDYIRQADIEIQTQSERYLYFMNSPILAKNDIELALYLDSKYQQNLIDLYSKRQNLEVYFTYNYINKIIKTPVNTISNMNIQTSGHDLMQMLDSGYYNLVVPYEKYFNSVDPGYYAYSFALNPLEKQPSGHINFSKLDDIVINTVNNSQVVNDPFILKTTVREYQILRIMSGMGALAFLD